MKDLDTRRVHNNLAADVNKIYSQFEREIELDSGRIHVIVILIRLFALYVLLRRAMFVHTIAIDILTPYEGENNSILLALKKKYISTNKEKNIYICLLEMKKIY